MQDELRKPDTRVWQFRVNDNVPGGIEKKLFESRADIPNGFGWFDSPPEAVSGVEKKIASTGMGFKQDKPKTVAEQVAELEAKAKEAAPPVENADDQAVMKKRGRPRIGIEGVAR